MTVPDWRVPLPARLQRFERLDRFTTVLALTFSTFVLGMVATGSAWGRMLVVVVQAATLVVALTVARAQSRVARGVLAVTGVAVVVALADPLVPASDLTTGARALASGTLAAMGPVSLWAGLRRRTTRVDLETVAGALSIYLMLGFTAAFAFDALGNLTDRAVFVQLPDGARSADTLYFAFTTMTTTGYGDLSAATDAARTLALLTALVGQLYLVTVVALIVSNLGRLRGERGRGGGHHDRDEGGSNDDDAP